MPYPKKIKIGSHTYALKEQEDLIEDENLFGYQWAKTGEIVVDASLVRTSKEETILHEVFEAVNFHNEVGLKHPQLTTLAAALYQFIKDNPTLVKQFMRK